jgi:catalase (peroxidase I)
MLMRQMRKQVKCLVMNHEMLSAQKWQVQVH